MARYVIEKEPHKNALFDGIIVARYDDWVDIKISPDGNVYVFVKGNLIRKIIANPNEKGLKNAE